MNMAVSAKDVMELRRQTDCGMMECKKALDKADGGINIKDESLCIDWRIPMEKAILCEKDLKHACLKDAVLDFDINDKLY